MKTLLASCRPAPLRRIDMSDLNYLDEIAREAHAGNYARTGVLSTGERM